VKPGVMAAIAAAFVATVAGVAFLGPDLVDAIAGKPVVPPPQPIARPAANPVQPEGSPPQDAGVANDAGSAVAEAPPSEPPPPEPPEPEPKPAKVEPGGFLTITSNPPGITVLHRGVEVGTTPFKRLALPQGKQALALEFKGKRKQMLVTVRVGKEQKLNLNWAKLK
jgi:eukaryotic-like serine/threonine-protein kinase